MGSRRSTTRQHLSAPIPLYLPHHFRSSPSTSSSLPPLSHSQPAPQSASPLNYHQLPLNPFQLVQKSVPQLNSQQFPPNPLRSPFQLAQKCAPTSQQVQNPALKCARPFLNGFKMRAVCAPRCANFPKNPIFSPKTHKTAIFDNTPAKHPTPRFRRPPAGRSMPLASRRCGRERRNVFYRIKTKMVSLCFIVCIVDGSMNESSIFSGEAILWPRR